jgi:hypothetical protein
MLWTPPQQRPGTGLTNARIGGVPAAAECPRGDISWDRWRESGDKNARRPVPSKAARRLQELKTLGVQISIDDFGTGYSSLAYLQQFPIDCLKIDRAFVEAITTSPESDALIRTLVRLGEDLGLTTLAEGVETVSQLQYLREHAVTHAQGFLLARPLSAEAVEHQILHQHKNQPDAMGLSLAALSSGSAPGLDGQIGA